jgi:hypothetical protein
MADRMRWLYHIPFRAVLTTNFDMFLCGKAPLDDKSSDLKGGKKENCGDQQPTSPLVDAAKSIPDQEEISPYLSVLRPDGNIQKSRMAELLMMAGVELDPAENRQRFRRKSDTEAQHDDPLVLRERPLWPVIKLHGSVDKPSTMVWTRSGYRKLTNTLPEYLGFLRSMLSTCTVLYMGFSFSDGYLNELRGEVLTMLYGARKLPLHMPPLAYAIIHDKTDVESAFFRRHEGVELLTWDTSPQGDKDRDWEGLTRYLRRIHSRSSQSFLLGKLIGERGAKILIQAWVPEDKTSPSPSGEDASLKGGLDNSRYSKGVSVGNLFDRNVMFDNFHLLLETAKRDYFNAEFERLEQTGLRDKEEWKARETLRDNTVVKVTSSCAESKKLMQDEAFDVCVCTYGEDRSQQGNHNFVQLLEEMRSLPWERRCPLVVYSSSYGLESRKKIALKHGVAGFCSDLASLLCSIDSILSLADD